MKKLLILAIGIIGLVVLLNTVLKNRQGPVLLGSEGIYLKKSIDDKIKEAELIVIGEVTTVLPSRWNAPDGNDSKNASPEEVSRAHGLFTDSLISIQQILKGNIDTPFARVRSFVGEIETVVWANESQPDFETKRIYLLFLEKDDGATAKVDPGAYISVNANMAVYEIIDDKAISADDEWLLEDLIDYIEKSLSSETPVSTEPSALPAETLLPQTETPIFTELPTATP